MDTLFVYVLFNRKTGEPRYVGSTARIKDRRRVHVRMKSARHGSRLAAWFAELSAAGDRPGFKIVAKLSVRIVYGSIHIRKIEKDVIRDLLRRGFDLLNEDIETKLLRKLT